MRYQEGVEGLLPLAQIRQGVIDLVNSEEAQEFVEKKLNGAFGIWDPRLLTELCSQVNEREEHDPLKQFAQKAALLELKLILRHILTTMGIDVSTENNRPKAERA